MKVNKAKANKILAQFKAKFPLLTVTEIYDAKEGTIVRAVENPEEFKIGVPYYQILPGNVVINANPYARIDWFYKIVNKDNMIYHNTDIDYPEPEGIQKKGEIIP